MKRMITLTKRVLLLAALSLVVMLTTVQYSNAQFTLGVKVAGNGSNYGSLSNFDAGVDAGVFLRFGNRFYFQPETYYSFKMSKIKDPSYFNNPVENGSRLKQHFVDMPLLLGFHFINNKNFKFQLFIGPRFGFRLGNNLSKLDDSMEKSPMMQYGGQIGFGFDFGRVTLDTRYDYGVDKLMSVMTAPDQVKSLWGQNQVIVSLGIKFIKE